MMKSHLGILSRQNAICEELQKRPIGARGNGLAIFPNETISKRIGFTIQKGAVEDGIKSLGLPKRLFQPIIIGCIRYLFAADMSQHATGFVFNVMHQPPEGILSAEQGDVFRERIWLINPEIGNRID